MTAHNDDTLSERVEGLFEELRTRVGESDDDAKQVLDDLYRAVHRQQHHQTYVDQLTGKLNGNWLKQEFPKEVKRAELLGKNFTFGLLDIDDFKAFNTQYGHEVGDDVIRHTFDYLATQLREADIVGRRTYGLSSDEGYILCSGTNKRESAWAIMKAITGLHDYVTGKLAEEHGLERETIRPITISIGMTELHDLDENEDPEEKAYLLKKKAGESLARAKLEGKNRLCTEERTYTPESNIYAIR